MFESLDGVGDGLRLHLAAVGEAVQGGHHDVGGVHFEMLAQWGAGVGEPEAVGAERDERLRHPAGDLVRYRLDEVGDGDDGTVHGVEDLCEVGPPRLVGGVEAVPAFDAERVIAQLLVAGRAPHVGGDVVVVG